MRRRTLLLPALLAALALPATGGVPASATPIPGPSPEPPRPAVTLLGDAPAADRSAPRALRTDVGALFAPGAPDEVVLGEVDGVRLVARLGPAAAQGPRFRVRTGSLVGAPGTSFVVLSSDGSTLTGTVTSAAGSWRIRSRGRSSAVLERVPARVRGAGDLVLRRPAPRRAAGDATGGPAAGTATTAPTAAADGAAVLDVLIPYTDATVSYVGSAAAVESQAAEAVASANASYANSAVPLRLRLVGTMQVAETIGPDGPGLERATASTAIRVRRDRLGADLVAVLTPGSGPYCGVGWLLGTLAGDPSSGFTVTDVDCAVGNLSFAHELGHNLGGDHDRFVSPDDAGLVRPWAKGYADAAHGFRTVMAYADGCPGCQRVPYWSDPARQRNGYPLGVRQGDPEQAHDAAVLAETAPVVSRYRPTAPVPSAAGLAGVRGDYTGDRKADVTVFRPSNSTWYVRGLTPVRHGVTGDVPVPADYTGDGRTDLAVRRPSTDTWYVRGGTTAVYGRAGDVPVPADYTGDGRADIAVFRPATSTWYVRGGPTVRWGLDGDVPAPADYDGDGVAEIAVFRPSSGTWHVLGRAATTWGVRGDVPVPADHAGDDRAELAVFRPSTSTWWVRGSASVRYGTTGDRPVAKDYTGDGQADLAVFRPSTSTWYVRGLPALRYGLDGDVAL